MRVSEWSQEEVLAAQRELGVLPDQMHSVVRGATTAEEANARFDELRRAAKRRYRQLALELHPDRCGGDPERARRFRLLTALVEDLEKIRFQPRPPPPPPVLWGSATSTTYTGSTTASHTVHIRIVFS